MDYFSRWTWNRFVKFLPSQHNGQTTSFFVTWIRIITKSGVQLLTAQKPIKRQGWWKGKFALFWMLATGGGGGQTPVQRPTPPSYNQWARAFMGWGRGLHAETVQAALTVILKLVIGGLTGITLIVLVQLVFSSRVSLFPFLWGQFSELWQLMSWLPPGHHVVNFFHLVGLSVSIRQLTGYGSEYYL